MLFEAPDTTPRVAVPTVFGQRDLVDHVIAEDSGGSWKRIGECGCHCTNTELPGLAVGCTFGSDVGGLGGSDQSTAVV